jgi:hypothetical protein
MAKASSHPGRFLGCRLLEYAAKTTARDLSQAGVPYLP